MISEESLQEFKRIYARKYSVELTDTEARLKAGRLVELFRILMRPPESGQYPKNPTTEDHTASE